MSERYRRHEAVVPTFEIKGRGMPRHPEHVVYRFTDTAQNESVAIAKITKDFPTRSVRLDQFVVQESRSLEHEQAAFDQLMLHIITAHEGLSEIQIPNIGITMLYNISNSKSLGEWNRLYDFSQPELDAEGNLRRAHPHKQGVTSGTETLHWLVAGGMADAKVVRSIPDYLS